MKMYNTAQKEAFIKELYFSESQRERAMYVFNAIEPYETKKGRDFCVWKRDEVAPVVGEIISARDNNKSRLSVLSKYVDWCLTNNIDGACAEIRTIKDFGNEKLRRQTVANPQHLQRYLNSICDPEAEDTVDNVYRCYFWLAYAGVKQSDALNITSSSVDLEKMLVCYGGREYQIYKEAIPAFEKCVTLEYFKRIRGDGRGYQIERAGGDAILRTSKRGGNGDSYKALQSNVSRKCHKQNAQGDLDLEISYLRLVLSGIFYRMYVAESHGVRVDFISVAAAMSEGKDFNERQIARVAREYEADYERWKAAYRDELLN